MNSIILQQYGIRFTKTTKGIVNATANDFNLGALIALFSYKDDVQLLLTDINLALNGQFNQIENPSWGMELGLDIYFGIINDDMTFSVYYENNPTNSIDYPLNDIKEIFISWLEFIS